MYQIVRVGKRNALYLPKRITEALGIKEGDKLMLEVRDNMIILRPLPKLFRERKYWSETTINEFERESEELVVIAEDEISE